MLSGGSALDVGRIGHVAEAEAERGDVAVVLQHRQRLDRATLPVDRHRPAPAPAGARSGSADIRCRAASRSNSRSGRAARARSARPCRPATRRRLRTNSGRRSSMPWVWSACSWVISTPSSQSTFGVEQLLAQVGRAVDQNAREPCLAPARVQPARAQRRRRFFGLFGSQSPQPSATRGTPIDEPQPRMVKVKLMRRSRQGQRGTLLNSRKKFSVVWRAISSTDTPRVSASTLAVSTT